MDWNKLTDDDSDDSSSAGTSQQKKSLVANVYSTDGDDKYKDLSDWEEFNPLAWELTRSSNGADHPAAGLVRDTLKRVTESGDHEEWYTQLQVALGHFIGEKLQHEELPDGSEPEGAVPLMELFDFTDRHIAEYLAANGEVAENLFGRILESQAGQEYLRDNFDPEDIWGEDQEEEETEEQQEEETQEQEEEEEPEAEADDD